MSAPSILMLEGPFCGDESGATMHREFNVRMVQSGDVRGPWDNKIHRGAEPAIEIFDATSARGKRGYNLLGQYITSFWARDVESFPSSGELVIDMGDPGWRLAQEAVQKLKLWSRECLHEQQAAIDREANRINLNAFDRDAADTFQTEGMDTSPEYLRALTARAEVAAAVPESKRAPALTI